MDGDPATRWGAAKGATNSWLEVDFGKPATVSRAIISEGWDRVRRFVLEAWIGGTWQPVTTGTTLGMFRSLSFEPVSAQVFRLNITEATDVPTLWESNYYHQQRNLHHERAQQPPNDATPLSHRHRDSSQWVGGDGSAVVCFGGPKHPTQRLAGRASRSALVRARLAARGH